MPRVWAPAALTLFVAALGLPASASAQLVMGSGPGSNPVIRVLTTTSDRTLQVYAPSFVGGVNVALGDVDGDGTLDVITGAGPGGGPHVRVFSGVDLHELWGFYAFAPTFRGGVSVAAGDIDGDGRADIITGAGPDGEPQVRVFSGADLHELESFLAYAPTFRGGVNVAAGDINGDGRDDIITGAGPGAGPHVRAFSGMDLHDLQGFFAYAPTFRGGVSVAAGDIDGDGRADIITGAGPGGGPLVRAFSGLDLHELHNFFPFSAAFRGGVRVAAGDLDGDGRSEVIVGAGPGGGPHVRAFSGVDLHEVLSFFAFPTGSGVSVGSSGTRAGLHFTSPPATSFLIGSAGTFTVRTVGIPVGSTPTPALTSTGALPAGVAFVDNGDGTATLSGTPGAGTSGAYPLTFTAANGVNAPVTQSFTLTVQQAPAITSAATVTFSIGIPGGFAVTTTGFPAPTLTLGGASLPAGVTFVDNGNGTGQLSGNPVTGTAGTYALTFTADNGAGVPAVQPFTLTVRDVLLPPPATAQLVMGAGPDNNPVVRVLTATGDRTIQAYAPAFVGGVNVAVGDIDGDGTPDIITGAGPGGGPHVRVFSGVDMHEVYGFYAFAPTFRGGVSVAAGDIDGDGRADIITGAGVDGDPQVRVFSGVDLHELESFLAYGATFRGGVNVAAGDIDGDGRDDIITGAGPGGGPHVRAFSGATLHELQSFFAYRPSLRGGVYVAAGDIDGDGRADIITGAGPGEGPHVRVFSGVDLHDVYSFFAYSPAFSGGVRVAAGDLDGDGRMDVITGGGPGGGPHVRAFSGVDLHELLSFFAFPAGSGVSVASTGRSGLRISSPSSTSFLLGSAGTFTVTTIGTPAPALSSTGTLPAGVTFVDNGDGTATLAGTPDVGTGGAYPLTFTATNSTGSTTQNFTLTVTQAPAITSVDATTFTVGLAASMTVTTTGFPLPTIARSGASLPAGITFVDNGDGTGTLSGTAGPGTGGSYALQFTATNNIGVPAVQTFTLTVSDGPGITSANTTTFTVGSAGTFTVTTVGSPPPSIVVGGALPAGVTLVDNGNGTATLAGTPGAGTGGAYPLTFTATNGVGSPAIQLFTLTVAQAPAITSAASTTFTVGSAGTFSVTTSGNPAPALTQTGALPAGVTFVDNGNGTATLAGTPAAGTGGTYALTFTAANGVGANAVQSFTLTVNQAPALSSANATTFTIGAAGTFTVTTTGVPAVASIARTGAGLPAGVTYLDNLNGTATLSGTPTVGTGGVYNVTFTINNGVGADVTQSFALTITEGPAFTSATSTTFTIGNPSSLTVTTTAQPAATITLGGTLPSGVTFVDNGDGTATLSGTPAAATGGPYNLTFTANNGIGGDVVQNFTLTVNAGPAFTSAAATTFSVGVAGTFTVTTTGVPSVTSIARTGAPLPTGVTFVDNLNGTATLSGTPAAGTGGVHNFVFTINNGVGPDVTQNFALTITEAPAFTSAASTTFTVGTAGTFTVTTSGQPAVTTITLGGATLPSGVTFVSNGNGTGTLSGTPAAGTGGPYALTFTANNGIGGNIVQNFTLTINEPPTITSVNTATFLLNTAGSFQVVMTGIPAPTVSVTTGTLPTGLTLSTSGVLSGTPTQSGSFAVTLTATNGTLPNATQAFTVLVNAAPGITSANSTTFTVGTPGSFTVVMTGFPAPTVALTAGTLPTGVTLSPAGVLSGTPGAGTGGTYNLTLTATNTVAPDATQNFTLTVNQAPAITSVNTATFLLNIAGATFQVVMTGFPAPTVSVTTGTLPTGLSLSSAGLLSGTPTQSGSFPVTLTATNATLPNATQAFTVVVNAPPAITSANNTTFTVGTAGTFTVATTGFPAPSVSQTGTLPTGVTFTPGTKVLAGTATQVGAFPLVFTATNAISPDAVQPFTLNVVCPAITVSSTVLPDGLYQVAYTTTTFTQTGSTGSSFTWSATGLPAGLTIAASTGAVSGTPTNTVAAGPVVITVTDNFGCAGTRSTAITVRPVATNESYANGVGNTQFVVGATPPLTPYVLATENANVKTGDLGPGALTVTFPATSTNLGSIAEGTTDGTFIYTPPVNFAGPTDSFTYTLTDGNLVTNTATVTIALADLVWYVNNSGGNGDGRSHSPFNSLANAATPSISNSFIYVHTGGGAVTPTPGNLALDAIQTLQGAGGIFTHRGLTIAAGTRPTLSGTVTLANSVSIKDLNFAGAGVAITASGLVMTAASSIDQVNVTGGTNALSLTNVTATGAGALNVSNTTFTNTSSAEVLISGGNVPIGFASTVVITSNAGRAVDISGRTAGAVTFAGPIGDSGGTGIILNANGASTFTFSGGITLNGASSTFTATNTAPISGTLSITGMNTIGATTPPAGPALNVANITIAGSGLTFRTVSSSGGSRGIILNTTGNGPFTVTGVGTTDGSGGTIQNASSRGAEFISANNITLSNMNFTANGTVQTVPGNDVSCGGNLRTGNNLSCVSNIHLQAVNTVALTNLNVTNGGQMGINGNGVSAFSLNDSVVTGNGNDEFENGLTFQNLTGTSSIANSMIKDNAAYQIAVVNIASNSTLTLGITGTRTNNVYPTMDTSTTEIGKTAQTNTFTNQSLLLDSDVSATNVNMTLNVTGVVFKNSLPGNSMLLNPIAGSGTFGGTTTDTSFDNTAGGVIIQAQNGMSGTYNVTNSEFNRVNLQSILYGALNPYSGALQGVASGNHIGEDTTGTAGAACEPTAGSNCHGIDVNFIGGTGSISVRIQSNTIQQFGGTGILVTANGGLSPDVNVNLVSNVIKNPIGFIAHGIQTNIGTTAGANIDGCVGFITNNISGTYEDPGVGTQFGIVTNVRFASFHRLPGYAGSGTAVGSPGTAVTDFIIANNTTLGKVFTQRGGTGTYPGGAACVTP